MKSLLMVVCALLMTACSSQSFPVLSDSQGWQQWGYDQGFQGLNPASVTELTELGARNLTDERYADYIQGYRAGNQAYCAQDPFESGKMQRPYYGACDESHPDFRAAYEQGQWEDDVTSGAYMSESDYE
ncbi:hypothetical protein VA7868_01190 [Vibrio aerogenes CECT 7868]|uniref:Lipoprotein n=1 Tax=Vibrio aerogenes CECT 7868 TaxID=1216006 RepID=A0A1M5XJE9_9VIBR|nr:DUF2799 domain-containing protein [Vibrio aerogenes]SHH99995.1 hypothetical protein VA7868_01190 [Vibrio aerogenes CECT 7868]